MRKVLMVIVSLLVLVVGSSTAINEDNNKVQAEQNKTKCVLTVDGGFFCEGNPGYESAKNRVNN